MDDGTWIGLGLALILTAPGIFLLANLVPPVQTAAQWVRRHILQQHQEV